LHGSFKLTLRMSRFALRVDEFVGKAGKFLLEPGDLVADLTNLILTSGDFAGGKLLRLAGERVLFLLQLCFQRVKGAQNAIFGESGLRGGLEAQPS
jgi:hypothetical protein